ncbi:MAG: riboflavin synthase [Gammaproteobacteria bacterium]|nr:MAG: riboflavin synthase [Gammaproteobacteria bacterium]
MFTGIIEGLGSVSGYEKKARDIRLKIQTNAFDCTKIRLGDSIAVNGVCLTAVETGTDSFVADVSAETLSCTTFSNLKKGNPVNLEQALTLDTRLGGHLVSGHVDGVGAIKARSEVGESTRFQIEAPRELCKYIAAKGSICIEGISLTVNTIEGQIFEVNIVPHTMTKTTLQYCQQGQQVNLEVDLVARYLERLVLDGDSNILKNSGITLQQLQEAGYLN